MANMAIPSKATVTFLPTGGMTATAVHGIVGITDIESNATAQYSVTTLESTQEEYLLSLPDSGTTTFALNFNLDDPGQALLYTAYKAASGGTIVITANSSSPALTKNTWTASVLVTLMGKASFGKNSQITGTLSVIVNSSTWADAPS